LVFFRSVATYRLRVIAIQYKVTTKQKDKHKNVHSWQKNEKQEYCLYSDQIIILIVELPALKYELRIVNMNKDIRLLRHSQFCYEIHLLFDTFF
jgi:hypothetical protein